MSSVKDLGKDNLRKLLWKLAVPAIITQFITMIYNIVDRVYVGHIEDVGGLAIAGLGVCTPLVLIIGAFSQLLCCGGGPIASAELGKNNEKDADKIASTSLISTVILAVVLTILLIVFDEPLLYMFGASSESITYAKAYMDIYVLGTLFILISTGMNFYIIAQGKTFISMIAVSSGAILNIIIDPFFIWGLNLGIRGAAVASVVSQIFSSLIVLVFMFSHKSSIRLSIKELKMDVQYLGKIILLGLSPFVMQITECAIVIAFNKSLLKYGGDIAVGCMALFTSVNTLVFLPINGLCQGAQPITSFNFGAGYYDRVSENIKRLIKYCLIYTTTMWLLILLFPKAFLLMFTKDVAIIKYGTSYIRVFFGMIFIIGIQVACQNSFLALKNAKISLFLAILRKVVLLIPLIIILPQFISESTAAVFLAEPVADTIAATITATIFYKVYKGIIFTRQQK